MPKNINRDRVVSEIMAMLHAIELRIDSAPTSVLVRLHYQLNKVSNWFNMEVSK